MHGEGFFFQAFVYLSAAVIAVPIAKRLGLGSVLGYLIAGAGIGPFGLRLVGAEGQDVMHFAEFGVVMMLFLVGLELRPALLWRLRGPVLGMGGLQLATTALVLGGVGLALGLPWQSALAIGAILANSSTAIALQSLAERGQLRTEGGQRSFAVLLFQDLAVIPLLALLPLLATASPAPSARAEGWAASLAPLPRAAVLLGAVAAVVIGGRFLIRPAFRAIARTGLRELFTAASLLLVIAIALLMTKVGLSPALGTFLAGVVLAESEYRHELEGDIEPFKGLLLGLFFIAVGAAVDFSSLAARPLLTTGLVLALVLLKLGVLLALGRVFRMRLEQSLLLAVVLAQGGEFTFVLFSFAAQNGVVDPGHAKLLVATVALSMALTPLLLLLHERVLSPLLAAAPVSREADAIDEEGAVIIAGFGAFGSIVGRLLAANGVKATVLDVDPERVELLRRLGLKVFYGDASRLDLLHAAGAARARLLLLALDHPEKAPEVVAAAQKHFPQLTVLARASGRTDAHALLEAGVRHVYRDTLDTSLRAGVDALRLLGFRAYQAQRAAQAFRRHDERSVRELTHLRHDRAAYLDRARAAIRDLEETLRAELERRDERRDLGWDAESLREEFGQAER